VNKCFKSDNNFLDLSSLLPFQPPDFAMARIGAMEDIFIVG